MPVPLPPTALAVCRSDGHRHDRTLVALDYLHRAAGRDGRAPSARTRLDVEIAFAALGARWQSCGPSAAGPEGEPIQELATTFAQTVLRRLPEADPDGGRPPSARDALYRMGISDLDTMDRFRRLVAVRAALAVAAWSSAAPEAVEEAAARVLREIDSPAQNLIWEPDTVPPAGSRRTREELAAVAEAVERRRCAGGPLVLRADGVLDRLASDEWIGTALAELAAHARTAGNHRAGALAGALDAMEIRSVDDLHSFRRLVAVHAALAAVEWTAAPPSHAVSAFDGLLTEIDDPSSGWT